MLGIQWKHIMKHWAIIAGVVFFTSISFAKNMQTYHNEEGHFSLTIPEGWEVVSVESLSSNYKEVLGRFRNIVAIVKLKNQSESIFPCMLIQFRELKVASSSPPASAREKRKAENFFKVMEVGSKGLIDSGLLRDLETFFKWIKTEEFIFPRSWKGDEGIRISGSNVYYDNHKHAAIGYINIDNGSSEKIVFGRIELLGSRRRTTFTSFWSGRDSKNFSNLFDKVISSFAYDAGYEFYTSKLKDTTVTRTATYEKISSMIGTKGVILEFIVSTVIFGVCLWLGMIITRVEGSFLVLLLISAVTSLAGLVPVAGFILAPVVMFILISKLLAIEVWPDAILIVVVANGIEMAAGAIIFANIVS